MKAAVASYKGIVFGLSSILFFTSVIGIKLTQEVTLRRDAVYLAAQAVDIRV